MLWKTETKQVLLARLDESSMTNDAKGERTFVKDYYRVKTYTKPDDMLKPFRERGFSEPYMIAEHEVGGTWNDHDGPFTVQIASCNMKCAYCFVPGELKCNDVTRGKYFSAREVVQMHDDNEPTRPVIRISGGEPFLAPEFLKDLAAELENRPDLFLWIDTNLTGHDYAGVIDVLDFYSIKYGICGCFKGFDEETFELYSGMQKSNWNVQWKNAMMIHDELETRDAGWRLFFYVTEMAFAPNDGWIDERIEKFVTRLQEKIGENAPLRTTVISLKDYDVNVGWRDVMKKKIPASWNPVPTGKTRQSWNAAISKKYPVNLLWLPQYQVPFS
jgi:uncharacterized Fe-S cluster-containing radical SAM superfamily protein